MGTIFDIQRCSVNDGPGLRTVLFLKGCPLRCRWCHNPESQNPRPELLFNYEKCLGCGRCAAVCSCHILENGVHTIRRDRCAACGKCAGACPADALEIKGRECTAEEVLDELRKDKKFYEKSHGGVTVSGGEPLMQPEFLREVLEKCRREGIHTALETSGCASRQVLAGVLPLVDLFLWDYKVTENAVEMIGVPTDRILENLKFAVDSGANVRLRCPIIPGVGDNETHLKAIAALSRAYPLDGVDILPYHNMGVFKSRQLGRTPWDADLANMSEERKEWISGLLTEYDCRNFQIL